MSDGKRQHYIPDNRKKEITENTKLSWNAYQNIPTESQKQGFVTQLLENLKNEGFIINNVDTSQVDYDTFYNIYSDKSTIEYARKRDEAVDTLAKDIFSDEDSVDDSQSAKDVCEVCDNNKVKCLCRVEFKNPKSGEEYLWTAGKGIGHHDFVYINSDDKSSHELSYTVDGTCKHTQNPCTKLYYSRLSTNKSDSELIEGPGKIGKISLEADFKQEKIYAVDIPNKKEDKVKYQITESNRFAVGENKWSSNITRIPSVLSRVIDFGIYSKVSDMPATIYGVSVLECGDYISMSKLFSQAKPITAIPFTKTSASIFILPKYSVEGEITFDLNGDDRKPGLKISGDLQESFGNDKSAKYTGMANFADIFSSMKNSKFFKLLQNILEKVNDIEVITGVAKEKVQLKFDLPVIKVKGSASIEEGKFTPKENKNENSSNTVKKDQKNGFFIKRTELELKADPFFGVTVKMDLLEIFAATISAMKDVDIGNDSIGIKTSLSVIGSFALLLKGDMTFKDSDLNSERTLDSIGMRAVAEFKIDAKLEIGIRAIIIKSTFTGNFKFIGSIEFGVEKNELGELGWYIGSTGLAFYWQVTFVMGVGGRKTNNQTGDVEDIEYGNIGIDNSGRIGKPLDVGDSIEYNKADIVGKIEELDTEIAALKAALSNSSRKRVANHQLKRRHHPDFDEELQKEFETMDFNLQQMESERNRAIQLKKSINAVAKTDKSERLIALTDKVKGGQTLSSSENQERLQLKRDLAEIRKDYKAPSDSREMLPIDQEQMLHKKRIKEIDDQLKGPFSEKALNEAYKQDIKRGDGRPTYENHIRTTRNAYDDELTDLTESGKDFDKVVLMDPSIFTHENLLSKDLEHIQKRLTEAYE